MVRPARADFTDDGIISLISEIISNESFVDMQANLREKLKLALSTLGGDLMQGSYDPEDTDTYEELEKLYSGLVEEASEEDEDEVVEDEDEDEDEDVDEDDDSENEDEYLDEDEDEEVK